MGCIIWCLRLEDPLLKKKNSCTWLLSEGLDSSLHGPIPQSCHRHEAGFHQSKRWKGGRKGEKREKAHFSFHDLIRDIPSLLPSSIGCTADLDTVWERITQKCDYWLVGIIGGHHSLDSSYIDGFNLACKRRMESRVTVESLADIFWEGCRGPSGAIFGHVIFERLLHI